MKLKLVVRLIKTFHLLSRVENYYAMTKTDKSSEKRYD